jgi:hypothetical protein
VSVGGAKDDGWREEVCLWVSRWRDVSRGVRVLSRGVCVVGGGGRAEVVVARGGEEMCGGRREEVRVVSRGETRWEVTVVTQSRGGVSYVTHAHCASCTRSWLTLLKTNQLFCPAVLASSLTLILAYAQAYSETCAQV